MRPRDEQLGIRLEDTLRTLSSKNFRLKGIQIADNRQAFVEQLVESIRRIKYLHVIRDRELSPLRAQPAREHFDPLKAAVLKRRAGDLDEAFWLVFLAVHFAKNRKSGWRLVRDVYGRLGHNNHWTWQKVSANVTEFRNWLGTSQNILRSGSVHRAFGNHRKYQSLNAWSDNGTGAAVASYVRWVAASRNHPSLLNNALTASNFDPRNTFNHLYKSMDAVVSFGRIGKFDYLTMIQNLGLASIEPDTAYLQHATGPLRGARLLFAGSGDIKIGWGALEQWLIELDGTLKVGMQVLEDAMCNWQKSPSRFIPFRG
jgi:hypothetical protein